jgi:hypothetical protein
LVRAVLATFALISLGAFAGRLYGQDRTASEARSGGGIPLRISALDRSGNDIATARVTSSTKSTELNFNHQYQPGDHIVIQGPQRIALRLDRNFSECLLYLPQGELDYEVPLGRGEEQTGSAYAPDSFSGLAHHVTARALNRGERTGYRNLALNPCDVLESGEKPPTVFPHSSTNSFARNLFDFAARNAIDGVSQNGHHGVWPYQSWGPEQGPDKWWKLDFGRAVKLNKIRLMVRADFPHDSTWKSAVIEFSDGTQLPIEIDRSPEFQEFHFSKREISWFRITKLVPEDPAKWCAFVEVEAWGDDLP